MSVPVNQVLTLFRAVSEYVSFAFKGSSTIKVSGTQSGERRPDRGGDPKATLGGAQFVVGDLGEPCIEDPAVHVRFHQLAALCGKMAGKIARITGTDKLVGRFMA
jgi:hypothetical protein